MYQIPSYRSPYNCIFLGLNICVSSYWVIDGKKVGRSKSLSNLQAFLSKVPNSTYFHQFLHVKIQIICDDYNSMQHALNKCLFRANARFPSQFLKAKSENKKEAQYFFSKVLEAPEILTIKVSEIFCPIRCQLNYDCNICKLVRFWVNCGSFSLFFVLWRYSM